MGRDYSDIERGELIEEIYRKDAEIERLQEKVEILEAEIRVMRKLPAAIDAAMSRLGG